MTRAAVLGVDAAWTAHHGSGVALVVEATRGRWRCLHAGASYPGFLGADDRGHAWPGAALIDDVRRRLGPRHALRVVAVDLPVARGPITRRRVADDAVTRAFAARKCGVHSPTPERPGPLACAVRDDLAAAGIPLRTRATRPPAAPALLEVYPHPALLALCGAAERLPYKLSRAAQYWPERTPAARRRALRAVWRRIVEALGELIDDLPLALPPAAAPARVYKAFEDTLDAVVCAWVATEYLAGRAVALGDDHAAVWVPAGAMGPTAA